MKKIMLIFALICLATPSRSAELGISSLVLIKGQCKSFVIGDTKYNCSSIIYSSFINGRVMISILTPGGAFSLSGGKDSQLKPTEYILEVDTVRSGNSYGVQSYPSNGLCKVNIEEDGSIVHSIRCNASNSLH